MTQNWQGKGEGEGEGGERVNSLYGRAAVLVDLVSLKEWASRNLMKFSKD